MNKVIDCDILRSEIERLKEENESLRVKLEEVTFTANQITAENVKLRDLEKKELSLYRQEQQNNSTLKLELFKKETEIEILKYRVRVKELEEELEGSTDEDLTFTF